MSSPNPLVVEDGGHLQEHLKEVREYTGPKGRWVYFGLAVLNLVVLAVMFLAYASLWPLG